GTAAWIVAQCDGHARRAVGSDQVVERVQELHRNCGRDCDARHSRGRLLTEAQVCGRGRIDCESSRCRSCETTGSRGKDVATGSLINREVAERGNASIRSNSLRPTECTVARIAEQCEGYIGRAVRGHQVVEAIEQLHGYCRIDGNTGHAADGLLTEYKVRGRSRIDGESARGGCCQ